MAEQRIDFCLFQNYCSLSVTSSVVVNRVANPLHNSERLTRFELMMTSWEPVALPYLAKAATKCICIICSFVYLSSNHCYDK